MIFKNNDNKYGFSNYSMNIIYYFLFTILNYFLFNVNIEFTTSYNNNYNHYYYFPACIKEQSIIEYLESIVFLYSISFNVLI